MFTVLLFDINASSSSGWPNMMMTDELVSLLCQRSLTTTGCECPCELMVVYEIAMFKSRLGIIRTSSHTSHVWKLMIGGNDREPPNSKIT